VVKMLSTSIALAPTCSLPQSSIDSGKKIGATNLQQKQALNHFLGSIEVKAFRIAQLAVGHREDALEIVQDAMLKLVQRYADRPQDEWQPLFFRILNNRITDHYRKTAVSRKFRSLIGIYDEDNARIDNDVEVAAAPKQLQPLEQAELAQDFTAVEKALKQLSLRQRQAFLLRAWQGLSVEETAFAMKCSEGSVKTHYSRAISTLKSLLGAVKDEDSEVTS